MDEQGGSYRLTALDPLMAAWASALRAPVLTHPEEGHARHARTRPTALSVIMDEAWVNVVAAEPPPHRLRRGGTVPRSMRATPGMRGQGQGVGGVHAHRQGDRAVRGMARDAHHPYFRFTPHLRAVETTGMCPHPATTDQAAIYPPALQVVLPDVTGKAVQQGIERDHQHLKGRHGSIRGFKTLPGARTVCPGHGFVRNLRDGFYRLGVIMVDPRIPRSPRLMLAWGASTARSQAA